MTSDLAPATGLSAANSTGVSTEISGETSSEVAAELAAELAGHDQALRRRGIEIWIGAEPTFTRRESIDGCWLWEAEGQGGKGADKEARARLLVEALAPRMHPRAQPVRAAGRHFPDEPRPRFCYGLRWPRVDPAASRILENVNSPSLTSSSGQLALHGLGGAEVLPGLAWYDGVPVLAPAPDERIAWLTVTPDPGVVEVNMAPAPDAATFYRWSVDVHAAAREAGLSPVRYRWNGYVADSGGGGQITLGGATPGASPFFVYPHLVPGLLRYLNRHPSLSYWFTSECVGSASQGPRTDEGVRERFEELGVALDRLDERCRRSDAGAAPVTPFELWQSLAPLVVDCSGNSHRAELNLEKLWSPYLPGRGQLGVVEFRALAMQRTAESMAAVGVLLRAIAARLALHPYREPLVEWGSSLHDRWALPHFLAGDLRAVLDDLACHDLGLGPRLRALLTEPPPPVGEACLGNARLTITPALEFWPLVGDVASQERRGARLVDSSTQRLQLMVSLGGDGIGSAAGGVGAQGPGEVGCRGWSLPLFPVEESNADAAGADHIAALRYRAFAPDPGLHPGLDPHEPLVLYWRRGDQALSIELHGWIPSGGVYQGLPGDAAEAARRRAERVVLRSIPAADMPTLRALPGSDRDRFAVDLRRLGHLATTT